MKLKDAKETATIIAKKEEYLAATKSPAPKRFPVLTAAAKPTDNGSINVTVVTCIAIEWAAMVSCPKLLNKRPLPLKRPNSIKMHAPIGKPNLKISVIFLKSGFSYFINKFADW